MKTTTAFPILVIVALMFIPALVEANSGDFSGSVAIGSSYAGAVNAPTNGAIIQGNVGIGSSSPAAALDVNGNLNANSLTLNRVPMPVDPAGRLTLSSTAAVMTADAINATTIYYLPYVGQNVPVYDGTQWSEQDISSSGVSLALNTANMPSAEVFDVYASMQSGSLTLCSLYWGGNTSRSSTAGGKSGSQDARIIQLNGLWVNQTAISASNCYNNTTAYTIAQNQGTYLGTFYTTAAGQTGIQCNAASASGGPTGGGYIDLFNTYNRVPIACAERDSVQYTYTTAAYRQAHGSTGNQINFVDGLQQTPISSLYIGAAANSVSGNLCYITSNLDSTTTDGKNQTSTPSPTGTLALNTSPLVSTYYAYPQLGLHYLAALEYAGGGTCSFNIGGQAHVLTLYWQF
ncbi:MAG TPA: hypothetical protein VMT72_02440 [Pseudolabrys sp.]|nr:hypothetical protein [Pseudolabrys sp.]